MKFISIIVAAGTAALAVAAPSKRQAKSSKLQFWGVNESGAEFGQTNLPGVYNKDYTWYDLNSIDVSDYIKRPRLHILTTSFRPSSPAA